MMYFRTARAAMVALTAIGMIFTTAAHAAPVDGPATSVYGKNSPTDPGSPTRPGQTGTTVNLGTPTVPSVPGPGLDTRGDVKVLKPTYVQYYAKNLTTVWTIRADSIGNYPVKDVSVDILHTRINPKNGHDREEEWIHVDFGDMAPGAVKTTTVTCQEKADRLPCHGVAVWLNALDRDHSNDWTSGGLFNVIFPYK
jgi:hypothetical protein